MIISKEVEVYWNWATRSHYEEKGYIFSKERNTFKVKITDLNQKSNVKIKIQCDYCYIVFERGYSRVREMEISNFVKTHSCKKCMGKRGVEEQREKQKRGLLSRGDKGYWLFLDNRNVELSSFISRYGSIDKLQKIDNQLYSAIKRFDERTLFEIVSSVGHQWETVSSSAPVSYYDSFNEVKKKIDPLIEKHSRFPTWKELTLAGVPSKAISRHGGISKLKEKMNYCDDGDLVDDRGFLNKSILEYTVAQFLIANKVSYQRDVFPFDDSRHTCDFVFETADNKKIYAEMWGYDRKGASTESINYNKVRNLKQELYSKNNIILISLEYDDMNNKIYKETQEYLKEKFHILQDAELKTFDDVVYLSVNKLSDEEIMKAFMQYSECGSTLPSHEDLLGLGMWKYLREVQRRHRSFTEFAKMFNIERSNKREIWNEDTIFDAFVDLVLSKNEPINKRTLQKHNYYGMQKGLEIVYGGKGLTTPKLQFYDKYLDDKYLHIHKDDVIVINKIAKRESLPLLDIL